jgi:elongation factor 1-alpha
MPWYKGPTLIETLDEKVIPATLPLNKPLRAVVQDIYPYENGQMIVACKIETGILTPEREVVFNPSGKKALLKKIMVFGSEAAKAEPGDSVGLILDDPTGVERGEVLSYPQNQPQNVKKFVAEVILFSGLQIKKGDVLTIRCGTAEKKCRVTKILTEIDPVNLEVCSKNPELLGNEKVGEIEFSALEPVSLEKYSDFPELGRFVIEGKKGTVAAGIVLDINN